MTLIQYRPLYDVPNRRDLSDRLTRAWSGHSNQPVEQSFVPAVDIQETPEAFTLYVELPGVEPDSIGISVTGDVLTLKGTKSSSPDAGFEWQHIERSFGSFTRSFRLASPIAAQKVAADSMHGVLRITLPKADSAQTRNIPING